MELFHVSEEPNIARFDPREPPSKDAGVEGLAVWTVDDARLRNYLLPRDCPRVTFYPASDSDPEDVQRLMGPTHANAVVAIEAGWLDRIRATRLFVYSLPTDGFQCVDRSAGYWIHRDSVVPAGVRVVEDCLSEIAARGTEIRIVPNLWPLRDAVVNSTLHFSCIRMRNAATKAQG